VDDNQFKNVPEWIKEYCSREPRISLAAAYEGNRSPAYARNIGFGFPATPHYRNLLARHTVSKFDRMRRRKWREDSRLEFNPTQPTEFRWRNSADWFYFTDCGCEHAKDLFQRFAECWKELGDSCVAISGPIQGVGGGLINRFMTEQGVLNPPRARLVHDTLLPQAIVTADALVAGIAFSFLGGFDETFTEAAVEDLDLGLRLRKLGIIGWAEGTMVRHEFAEDRNDFVRRFRRYGAGNRRLEVNHNLPSLRARKYIAEKPEFQELANLQVGSMQVGYDGAVDANSQGSIIISNGSPE
jgi:hypothetical protein